MIIFFRLLGLYMQPDLTLGAEPYEFTLNDNSEIIVNGRPITFGIMNFYGIDLSFGGIRNISFKTEDEYIFAHLNDIIADSDQSNLYYLTADPLYNKCFLSNNYRKSIYTLISLEVEKIWRVHDKSSIDGWLYNRIDEFNHRSVTTVNPKLGEILLYLDRTRNSSIYEMADIFDQQFTKPIDLEKIKEIAVGYQKYWKDRSEELKDYPFAPVDMGDILYYDSSYGFPFGHTATVMGQTIQQVVDVETCEVRMIPLIYKSENGTVPDALNLVEFIRVVSGEQGIMFRDTKYNSILPDIYATAYMEEGQREMTVIRYIGPRRDEVVALVTILSLALSNSDTLHYSGIFYLIFHSCKSKNPNRHIQKVISDIKKGDLNSVCSGFTMLLYQVAMHLLDMDEEIKESLSVNPHACYPNDVLNLQKRNPKFWSMKTVKGFCPGNINPGRHVQYERMAILYRDNKGASVDSGYDILYPIVKRISPEVYYINSKGEEIIKND